MHLLPDNQVQIPLTKLCPKQNFLLIKRFRDSVTFSYPLPLETMLLPNSFTHTSYTHQLYNCSHNERAKAANWHGNSISNPATFAVPCNHLSECGSTDHHALTNPNKNDKILNGNWSICSGKAPQFPGYPDFKKQFSSKLQELLVHLLPIKGQSGISLPFVVS